MCFVAMVAAAAALAVVLVRADQSWTSREFDDHPPTSGPDARGHD